MRRVTYHPAIVVSHLSSRSVSLLFYTNTLALWPTVTIRRRKSMEYIMMIEVAVAIVLYDEFMRPISGIMSILT